MISTATPTDKLKQRVLGSKALIEAVLDRLKELERKRSELFYQGKISFDVSMEIGALMQPIYQIFQKDKLPLCLDDLIISSEVIQVTPYFVIDETVKGRELVDLTTVLKTLGFSLNTLFEKPLPTVEVRAELREFPTSKPIDNILYTYTPFKLRGSRGEYQILLVPSTRRHNIDAKWCNEDAQAFYEEGIKIITPDEIRPTWVNELKETVYVTGEQNFRFEIDRRSPENTYYCRMGYYISPALHCYRRECWLWDRCQGKRFWKGPKSLYGVGKVSPKIQVKVDKYEDVKTIISAPLSLFFIEKIGSLYAKVFIEAIYFLSSYFTHSPMIRLKEAPGYRIRTRSIAFAIDAKWLNNFVRDLLTRDRQLFAWIFTKYFVFTNYDVNNLRNVTSFFWRIINSTARTDRKIQRYSKKLSLGNITDELINFGCKILLHSLAHLLHQEVVGTLQTSPDNLTYYYSMIPEHDNKYRVFILENAERGLGLTESFAAQVKKMGQSYINELIYRLTQILLSCSRIPLTFVPLKSANQAVRTVWNRVNEYNRIFEINYGITMPVELARYILSRDDPRTSNLVDRGEVAPYIDDILSATQVCWDGCYNCVRLDMECHNTPYEQLFTVSKQLLTAFLNELARTFKRSVPQATVMIGGAKNLFNYINSARKSVWLTSPWISKKVAKAICDIAKQRGIRFRILTTFDLSVETHKEALKIFKENEALPLEVRVLEDKQLHVKMVIVDQQFLIIGSVNLTLSGLYENIEGYVVLLNVEAIRSSSDKFNELWERANSLTNVDLL